MRLDLEDARIDALLALGQFTRASSDLVTLVAAEPLREPRTRQLTVALYWSGRQADALAAYRALRDHLAEELGVDPDADTTALELAILRQDAALSPAIRDRPTPTAPGIVRRLVAPPDPRDIPTPTPQLAQLVADRLAAIDIDAQRWVLKAALLDEHATLPILADAGTALAHHTHEVTGLLRAAWLVVRGGGPWGEVAPIVHRALDALDMAQAAELSADLCAAAAAVAPNATGRAGLLTRLTRALARADRAHEAHVAWVEAVAQARQTGDPEAFALAVLAQEWAFRNLDAPPVTAVDLLREALDRLGPRPSALRLGVLTALIRELVLLSRERVGVPELVAEAEHHAALLDDAESRTTILNTRHILLRACPDLARRRRVADALAEEAPRTQDPERWLPRVWTARLYDSYTAGDLDAVPDLAAQLLASAVALDSQRVTWHHHLTQATWHRDRGDFATADEWADQAAILGASAGLTDAAAAASLHRYLTLFLTANTSPVVPVLRSFLGRAPDASLARALLTLALAQGGDRDAADALLDEELAASAGGPPIESTPLALGALADAVVLLGRIDVAPRLASDLAPFAGQWLAFGQVVASWGPADRCRAILTGLVGDRAEGGRLLERARALAARCGASPWVARCDADLERLSAAAASGARSPGRGTSSATGRRV